MQNTYFDMCIKISSTLCVPEIKQDYLSLPSTDMVVIFFWPKEGIIGPAEDAQLQPPSDMTNRVQINFKHLEAENHSLLSHPRWLYAN